MKLRVIGVAVASALALTGCTVSVGRAEKPSPAATSATPSAIPSLAPSATPSWNPPPEPTTPGNQTLNAHGNLPKAIGELGGLFGPDGSTRIVRFEVTAITLDFTCTPPATAPPLNGQYVALDITVWAYPALGGDFIMGPSQFFGYDAVGTTVSPIGAPVGCLTAADHLPPLFRAGSVTKGRLVFDMPKGHGSLAFEPSDVDLGWEWGY